MFRFFKVKYYLHVILLASTLFSICKTHNPEESNFNTITLLENNLENELIQISNGVNSLTATIENLSTFAKTHELNYLQVKNLWRFLYLQSISNHTSEKNNQSNIKKDTMNEEINYETKDSIGFYQLMIIMLVGYIIVGHLVKSTIMSLYFSEKYKFLFFLSLFFSYNLMVVAKTLQDQMEASFLPAIIYITVFLNLILCIHLILIKLRLQTALTLEQELYDIDNNKTGKIIMTIMGIILGYIFSFSCISPLVQLPFYFFLFYLVNLFRGIYIEKFSERLEPIILSTNSFFAFFLFGYLYFRGLDSFHEWIFLFRNVYGFEYLFSLIGQLKLINIIDFRFFGYLISVVILCSVFPLYLYIQNKNLWDSEFKYEKVLSNLKVEIAKENIEFDFSRIYFFIYGILLLFMVCFTLRERFVVGTLICLFCLVNFLNFSLRNQTFIGKSISFIGGFFLLTSIHLVGIIEDRFAPLVKITIFFIILFIIVLFW